MVISFNILPKFTARYIPGIWWLSSFSFYIQSSGAMWYRLSLPPSPQENQAYLGENEEPVMWIRGLYERLMNVMGTSTHYHHIFFSKDCLGLEAIESFLQRKTLKLLTGFCVLHTAWVRVFRHFFGWVSFSPIIVHLQICDFEKLRKDQVPGTLKYGCRRYPLPIS